MMFLIQKLRMITDKNTFIDIDDYCYNGATYLILNTKELGRILFTHTNKEGTFYLGEQAVQDLFNNECCDCVITCYPAVHAKIHLKLVEYLNIQYTDYNASIRSTWDDTDLTCINSIDDDDVPDLKDNDINEPADFYPVFKKEIKKGGV